MNIGGIVFPLEQQSKDEDSVVYHAQYDTEGVPHTKSGDRQPVQVSMEVRQLCHRDLLWAIRWLLLWEVQKSAFFFIHQIKEQIFAAVLVTTISLSVQFNKAGSFETVWQAKYYNYYKREHCQFGNKFSSIDYECKPNETRTLMWINKETFNWVSSPLHCPHTKYQAEDTRCTRTTFEHQHLNKKDSLILKACITSARVWYLCCFIKKRRENSCLLCWSLKVFCFKAALCSGAFWQLHMPAKENSLANSQKSYTVK